MSVQKTSEKHPVLYHYTIYDGFKGIMRTQTLWAKYFRDLNDTSEIFHFRKKLCDLVVPRIKKEIKKNRSKLKPAIKKMGGIDAVARHDAEAVLKAFFDVTFGSDKNQPSLPPYIVSFCSHIDDQHGYTKENGLLSMWRGYGVNGGIALVFDTKKLEDCLQREEEEYCYSFGTIGDVVYEGDDVSFLEEFGSFVEIFKQETIKMLLGDEEDQVSKEFIQGFLNAATRYKHRAFAEEREVRIVMSPWTDKQFKTSSEAERKNRKKKEPTIRTGSKYIDLFDGDTVPRLPITKVIIGPHREQEARCREVSAFLKARRDIKIVCSQTPYIGDWSKQRHTS